MRARTCRRDLARDLTAAARALPDTDWHVEKLYAFARDAGATLIVATHSRYVVDLNRDPAGASLYPGADNTELCPTRTFANEPIYVGAAAPDERRSRRAARSISTRTTPRSPPRSSAFARGTATRSCSTDIRFAPTCRDFSRAGCRT